MLPFCMDSPFDYIHCFRLRLQLFTVLTTSRDRHNPGTTYLCCCEPVSRLKPEHLISPLSRGDVHSIDGWGLLLPNCCVGHDRWAALLMNSGEAAREKGKMQMEWSNATCLAILESLRALRFRRNRLLPCAIL